MKNLLQIATVIVGTMMSLAYFPQAYQIYKNKSGFNISIPTFLLFGIGTLLWTVYGISIGDWILIVSFLPGVIGSWLILFLTVRYRHKKDGSRAEN
jgi:uncharacterized protein with PQ loop repeat